MSVTRKEVSVQAPIDYLVGVDGSVTINEGIFTKNMWITLSLIDGMVFEGTIKKETSYGIYMHIGGSEERLSLFPWHVVSRVVYRTT